MRRVQGKVIALTGRIAFTFEAYFEEHMWSIGIYLGENPFHLREPDGVSNPILTRENVTDIPASFVADPFMIRNHELWYMFFEALNRQTGKGEIGLAVSEDGRNWIYQQVVLSEQFHLSYPYVFEWNGVYYMIPETLDAGGIHLYQAEEFPTRWRKTCRLFAGRCADPSIFRLDNRWWMFGCSKPYRHDTLCLYFAKYLMGPWQEHPANPIVADDKSRARPGGRILVWEGRVVRFAQDCIPRYGTRLRAFEILELSDTAYAEKEIENGPFESGAGKGWNELGMHHIDLQRIPDGGWVACVDGRSTDG